MPRVLIAPSPIRSRPGSFRDVLHAAGFETIDPEGGDLLSVAEQCTLIPDCDAMIAGGEPVTAEVMDAAPGLRVIARTGVGYDAVDVPAATARGIVVTITPGTNHDSVAEQAFALLLAVARRVVVNDQTIRRGGWDRTIVQPLRGRTLGLVGLGRIGRAMVPRARAFGMDVAAFDLLPDDAFDAQFGVRRFSLDDLFRTADVVSLHLPLTDATRGLINAETLVHFKPGAILINTARGGLIDETALRAALIFGPLSGAGLDVFGLEPPLPDHPFFALPNIVLSPHIAGVDTRSMADMAELAARCVVDLHQGRWPAECIVNPEVGASWRW